MNDLAGRPDVERLVRDFYRQAAMDDLLGPYFESPDFDWTRHLAVITDFWCWQLFGEHRYEGNPLRAHEPLHARAPLRPEHYERWLELFCDTVDDRWSGPVADTAKGRAHKMAAAMQRLLDGVSAPGDVPIEPLVRRR